MSLVEGSFLHISGLVQLFSGGSGNFRSGRCETFWQAMLCVFQPFRCFPGRVWDFLSVLVLFWLCQVLFWQFQMFPGVFGDFLGVWVIFSWCSVILWLFWCFLALQWFSSLFGDTPVILWLLQWFVSCLGQFQAFSVIVVVGVVVGPVHPLFWLFRWFSRFCSDCPAVWMIFLAVSLIIRLYMVMV